MWTWASTLVPRSSSRPPRPEKTCWAADGFAAATACAAAIRASPWRPAFWCSTKTANTSPNSIPPAISAMPPKSNRRRALAGAKVSLTAGIAWLAMSSFQFGTFLVRRSADPFLTKRRHDMLGEHVLSLDALPVFEPTKIGNNGQFSDAALLLQSSNLLGHLVGSANKADLLADNLLVGEPGQGFQRTTGIKPVALGAQLSLLFFSLERFDR